MAVDDPFIRAGDDVQAVMPAVRRGRLTVPATRTLKRIDAAYVRSNVGECGSELNLVTTV